MPMIDDAVTWAENIANDNSHGYAQDKRNGNPDYDCSSFIGTALNQASFSVSKTSTTVNLYEQLKACGFVDFTITSPRKRGDIFLTPAHHVVMCTDANNIVHASINEKGATKNGKAGDQTGKEICVRSFYTPKYGWKYHLRYTGNNSESSKADKYYIVGKTYTLKSNVNVRKGHSATSDLVGYNALTADGKKHDKDRNGSLDKGTVITCKEVYEASDYTWIRCPSGWLAAYNKREGKRYIE